MGVSVDLARELARRLGVSAQFVTFDAAGKVVEAMKSGSIDVAFVAIDPARAVDISYSAAYVVIEGAYLVEQNSPIRSNDEENKLDEEKGIFDILRIDREVILEAD